MANKPDKSANDHLPKHLSLGDRIANDAYRNEWDETSLPTYVASRLALIERKAVGLMGIHDLLRRDMDFTKDAESNEEVSYIALGDFYRECLEIASDNLLAGIMHSYGEIKKETSRRNYRD